MSHENVDLVQRGYRMFVERREPPWELYSPECEFDVTDVMPDMSLSRGRDAAEPLFRSYTESFDDFNITLEEVIASDEEHVVTAVRDGGQIRGSDAEIWNRFFHAFTFRDGKIVRWSSHLTRDQALKAVGLQK